MSLVSCSKCKLRHNLSKLVLAYIGGAESVSRVCIHIFSRNILVSVIAKDNYILNNFMAGGSTGFEVLFLICPFQLLFGT